MRDRAGGVERPPGGAPDCLRQATPCGNRRQTHACVCGSANERTGGSMNLKRRGSDHEIHGILATGARGKQQTLVLYQPEQEVTSAKCSHVVRRAGKRGTIGNPRKGRPLRLFDSTMPRRPKLAGKRKQVNRQKQIALVCGESPMLRVSMSERGPTLSAGRLFSRRKGRKCLATISHAHDSMIP